MRRIDTYGLTSSTKAKIVVWWYFRKYEIKKIKEKHVVNDIFKLDQHDLWMLSSTCLTKMLYRNPWLKPLKTLNKKVSPNYSLLLTTMSCWPFVRWNTERSRVLTPLVLEQEVLKYRQHVTHTNPVTFEDNHLFVSCWTFVLSHRTSRRYSEDISESGHHDSSSFHTWRSPFGSKD